MLAYENIINVNPDAFIAKVKDVSERLDIDPNWLMVVMRMESNFRRKIRNKTSNAVGFLQFMPDTLAALWGTQKPSTIKDFELRKRAIAQQIAKVRAMTGVEQLEQLVYPYLRPYKGRMNNIYDLYLAVFMPIGIGKPDSYVLGDSHATGFKEKVYRWNKNLDLKYGNADGLLTVADIKKWVNYYIPKGFTV